MKGGERSAGLNQCFQQCQHDQSPVAIFHPINANCVSEELPPKQPPSIQPVAGPSLRHGGLVYAGNFDSFFFSLFFLMNNALMSCCHVDQSGAWSETAHTS